MCNKGFTLIEMIFVISILSMIMMLTMFLSINAIDKVDLTNGIYDLETKLEYLETKSIATKKPILVWFKPNSEKIYYQIERNQIQTLTLYKGNISKDNKFTTLVYDGEGNINQFGTLKIIFNNKKYKIIFRIEKGRYRIVEE
ncbi:MULTISPECIES: competence type IV pilus minor pilin ComGD [Mammaliicoccus]|uniref:Type II secretion system protein n=1 Tax=Mammaliicoccus fleurettii TaxID=150056 RepID=A0ABS5MKH5_9STAP|nr:MULTISPECIES: competence type IV pilus minor pilin ComGD [Mammaliicoccus]HCN60468.1 type II secretion system protein [Staphylococcus sp.]MBL0846198.1 type II secretion system protein [Mammaliicoccus fleurettii]MBO3062439.1 type II secretion system protein [Mammaliicoccus fleurettii]MBS3671201.1 type II secretion system protein [Mammaliicoccus fleurettii]MBS3696425.1 type II secretion system protein [Mammaliicoccus fleurettii]